MRAGVRRKSVAPTAAPGFAIWGSSDVVLGAKVRGGAWGEHSGHVSWRAASRTAGQASIAIWR